MTYRDNTGAWRRITEDTAKDSESVMAFYSLHHVRCKVLKVDLRSDGLRATYHKAGTLQPGLWKEKEHGYYCLHCEDGLWNNAIRLTKRVKQSLAEDMKKYEHIYHQAFAMGQQKHLGANSFVHMLNNDLVRIILDNVNH